MPANPKVTREMIVGAAVQILRKQGWEAISARTVARQLGCSTQPVMYNFASIDALIEAVGNAADEYHTRYLQAPGSGSPMLALGLNYIRFAHEEPQLFRFLFQSNRFSGADIVSLVTDPANTGLLEMVSNAAGISREEAAGLFRRMFILAHGYASLFANNAMEYNEEICARDLKECFGAAFPIGE